ncbi:hypothetical protein JCM10207_007802, partial [Rhodosporidiobolus poonsookiae]
IWERRTPTGQYPDIKVETPRAKVGKFKGDGAKKVEGGEKGKKPAAAAAAAGK